MRKDGGRGRLKEERRNSHDDGSEGWCRVREDGARKGVGCRMRKDGRCHGKVRQDSFKG